MAMKRSRKSANVYYIYQLLAGVVFWSLFPLLLIIVLVTGKHRRGLAQRLGLSGVPLRRSDSRPRIWIHAASIGEVRVAAVLIDYLKQKRPDTVIVISTMTLHGRDFARTLFEDLECFLAPLDVPFIVDWVLNRVDPNLYICMETELWPLLIQKIHRSGRRNLLLNGRISDRTVASYQRLKIVFDPVIDSFDFIGAISDKDRDRFIRLGALSERVEVTGNLKYDPLLKKPAKTTPQKWRELLDIDLVDTVVVGGSTHDPEEQILIEMIELFRRDGKSFVWLIAPRHLNRLPEIEALFTAVSIPYQHLSSCLESGRKEEVIIVDTIGELVELYSIATLAFIGGSLCNYGGHNMYEAAVWSIPVLFGPHTQNFHMETEALVTAGGGFRVADPSGLKSMIGLLTSDQDSHQRASAAAQAVVASQQGAGEHQVELVTRLLDARFAA
ncbi:MAG: hypothetical protein D6B25_04915 [Desulfobulbaceae bacterium]|nr:MAG: hypothetical protein D6B25_04915 [Desulfobulbaceae bacterium]